MLLLEEYMESWYVDAISEENGPIMEPIEIEAVNVAKYSWLDPIPGINLLLEVLRGGTFYSRRLATNIDLEEGDLYLWEGTRGVATPDHNVSTLALIKPFYIPVCPKCDKNYLGSEDYLCSPCRFG